MMRNSSPKSARTESPDPRTLRALGCREQMVKEHPTALFGEKGSGAAQRDFFERCMERASGAR